MSDSKKTGRKTALWPEVTSTICDALEAGAFLETAFVLAGVSKSAVYEWLRRGNREKSGPYRDFADSLKKANATCELRLLQVINTAAPRIWFASAWLLERRWPSKWARRTPAEGTHPAMAKG